MANVKLEDLRAALKRPLAPAYLVCGDEPLLVGEAADLDSAAARAAGYSERSVHFIEKNFDWDALRGSTQSLSLFAQRRILELRLPTGKPDKGAALLSSLALQPMPDLLTLVLTGKIGQKGGRCPLGAGLGPKGMPSRRACRRRGRLAGWLAGRAALAGATLTPGAAALIAERVEGNLLAAKQELEKLCLLADGGRSLPSSPRALSATVRATMSINWPTRPVRETGLALCEYARAQERGHGADARFMGAFARAARTLAGARGPALAILAAQRLEPVEKTLPQPAWHVCDRCP